MNHSYSPAREPARGIIQREISLQHYELKRYLPSADLAPFVENYWVACWDLRGEKPYRQGNLPHPCQNLVINPDFKSGIFGVPAGKYTYTFKGRGRIFGIRFWPGAFHAFYKQPVNALSRQSRAISDIFNVEESALEAELLSAQDLPDFTHTMEDLLRTLNPELDPKSVETRRIVELIEQNRDMVSVSALADIFEKTPRALQRLFDIYIGPSPKWVIDRYRMLEAVAALDDNASVSIVDLANRLGYFDQAHFTRAFTKLVGRPPSRYNFN